MIGNSSLIAHQEFSKLFFCTTQTSASLFIWLISADERELRERQNSAKCFQVCLTQLGGHWRFQDRGLPDGASRRLH